MILHKQNILLLIIILFFSSISFCQNEFYDYGYVTQPFTKYFSAKEYNAGASNWAITQDHRGIMYFGNSRGLIEYDGINWREIKIPFSPFVRALATDDSGKIFLTASTDFGYLEPDSIGQLKFVSLKNQLDKVRKIEKEYWDVAVNSKAAFFKTPDEIIRWDGKDFKIWDSVYAFRLYKIGDDIYSRNQEKGLMKIDGDSIYVIPDGDFFNNTGVFDMLQLSPQENNQSSQILITTNYSGLFIYDGKKNLPFKTEIDEFLLENQIYNACILKNGNIALATQRGGVVIIDRKGMLVRFINQNTGLPTNVAYDVYPDKLGGLWIASNEGIVFSETNSPLSLIPAEGQLRSQVISILRYDNKIYVANDIGVLVLDHGKSDFELIKGSNKPAYQLLDFKDHLIAATNWGLKTVKGKQFASELDPNSITYLYPSSIFPDIFYYSGRAILGIVKAEDRQKLSVKTFDLATDEISSVVEGVDSTLWITQYERPIWHINTKFKGFEEGFGKNSIQIDDYKEIGGLPGNYWALFNFDGRFLLGTDNGIYKFDKKKNSFVPDSILGAEFTTPNYFISLIVKSKKEGYWILAEVKGHHQLGKALLQKDGKFKWEPMPLFQRMDIDDVNTIYPDYDPINDKEILWISTSEGLIYYDPEVEKNLQIPFLVSIRKAIVKNDSIVFGGSKTISGSLPNLVIPFSQNDIRFEFSAASYEKSASNQYQYYLEGSGDGWSEWTNETKKDYTNLSGGNYTFRVRAKNIYGVISSEDSFSFKVLPPWYLSWWAYTLYALMVILGIFITDRIMRRKIINRERDRAKLREVELVKKQADELETVDRLVKVINRAEDLDQLFNSLLKQTFNLIPQTEKSAIFLLDKKDNLFRVAFTQGYKVKDLEEIKFTSEELKKRYTQNAEEVEKGIFIISNTEKLFGDEKLTGFGKAMSMLVMAVDIDNITEAYVVFDSYTDKNAFDRSTARLLNRFREHAVSAISKAQAMKTLQEKNDEIVRTQQKLVTQEKLASLGTLTAGIAHEIKNPLNFVNNFTEVSRELLDDLKTELDNNNTDEVKGLIENLQQNLEKINQHGSRADSIVNGMLLHSRGTSGEKILTDINELLDQYVALAYHGLRAQNKEFNITIEKDYDRSVGKINIVPQDISRVFLNIINNACYAANHKKKSAGNSFSPVLNVSTHNLVGKIEIIIKDNGNGIPASIKEQIFNPFFTTKPAGEGTGLGLSLSYDIITKVHGGELKFESEEGKFTEFTITLPKS
jgi:signal transduction histidine kinase